jgi:hypothetical protein
MAGFWSRLSGTLRELETLAADPHRLDEEALDSLRTLQYRLHWSSELLAGVQPPDGVRAGHEELADALVEARDATAEMVDAIEAGGHEAAARIVLEWRGALFRVRLARMRSTTEPPSSPAARQSGVASAAIATGMTVLGAACFAAGAVLGIWPLWAAGLGLVAAGFLLYRP